jgi:hypothetical protein
MTTETVPELMASNGFDPIVMIQVVGVLFVLGFILMAAIFAYNLIK